MTRLLLIALGGAFGAMARYGVGRMLPGADWHGTLTANVLGGLLMGALAGWLAVRGGAAGEQLHAFAAVGLLGGFTTFSAFSLETALMIERRQLVQAGGYAAASVLLSVAALFLGLLIVRRVVGAPL